MRHLCFSQLSRHDYKLHRRVLTVPDSLPCLHADSHHNNSSWSRATLRQADLLGKARTVRTHVTSRVATRLTAHGRVTCARRLVREDSKHCTTHVTFCLVRLTLNSCCGDSVAEPRGNQTSSNLEVNLRGVPADSTRQCAGSWG
jgi:hypothetical protein